jgi:FdhD protein
MMQPIAGAPRLSAAATESVRQIEVVDDAADRRRILIPSERPLTVLIDDRELVTLMTLGGAPELLVLGFLVNQRLVDTAAAIESIDVDWNAGVASVKMRAPSQAFAVLEPRPTAAGQGSVFKRLMAHADSIRLPSVGEARLGRNALLRVLDIMREHDAIHKHARSVHSCALLQAAELLVSVEDVSRHNALDTVCGWAALHGISGVDKLLFTTGRLTGEMVIKAAQSGVPIVISRNGVSAMGHDLAKKFGMTLIGRAVKKRFICYAGEERLDLD